MALKEVMVDGMTNSNKPELVRVDIEGKVFYIDVPDALSIVYFIAAQLNQIYVRPSDSQKEYTKHTGR